MSEVLTIQKTRRGWIMDLPPEMAQAMGVAEGSLAVLYPQVNGLSYEILPPLPPDMEASVLQTCERYNEAFLEMKRLGNTEKAALLRQVAESMKANSFTGNPPRFTREELPGIDLATLGISPAQAAELRFKFSTFEDWNDPAMDIYNDYDAAQANLNEKS